MGPLITDGYDLEAIARKFGTPLFVFSGDAIRERVDEFRAAFGAECRALSSCPRSKPAQYSASGRCCRA